MDIDGQSSNLPSPLNEGVGLHNTIPGVPPVSSAQPVDNLSGISSFNSNPVEAQDDDLIEKEWIHRVEHIVKTYKEDPFNQLKELNKLKADYIKKRYNKIIQDGE